MSIFLNPAVDPAHPTFAGGEATIAGIVGASFDNMLYVDNSNAAYMALSRAWDERVEQAAAFGLHLENPLDAAEREQEQRYREWQTGSWRSQGSVSPWEGMEQGLRPTETAQDIYRRKALAFSRSIEAATADLPDRSAAERLTANIDQDAARVARESDERLSALLASRPGPGAWAALLAGGMAASVRDQIAVVSMFAGGGAGGARSLIGRVLTVATKEALVNAATEAAVQPTVQAWREKVGLDHGLSQAVGNVLFAGLIGAGFGGLSEGVGAALRPLLRGADVDRAAARAMADPRPHEDLRAALSGDADAAARVLEPLRDLLPADARGALDSAAVVRAVDAAAPNVAPPTRDMAVASAERAAETGRPPEFVPDPAQVERIVAKLLPPAPKAEKAQSLVEFLTAHGGVLDQGGELANIGAEDLARDRSRPAGRGRRAVPDRRVPLDTARELAEEAGYIGRAGETQVATIDDLLQAIDEEKRGRPVHARGNEAAALAGSQREAQRAWTESLVHDVASVYGVAAPDATIEKIARLAAERGIDPADAIELAFPPAAETLELSPPAELAELIATGDRAEAKKAAGKYARAHFAGREVVNLTDGTLIQIGNAGIKHTLSRRLSRPAIAALTDLENLVAGARRTGVREDKHGRENVNWHYYTRDVSYLGKPARIAVAVTEAPDGMRYYDHVEVWGDGSRPGDGSGQPGPSLQDRGEPSPDNIGPQRGADNGLDDPASPDEAFGISDAEISALEAASPGEEFPFFDDAPAMTPAELRARLDHDDDVAALVEACKA